MIDLNLAWPYVVCSTIGLYSNIYYSCRKEKRKPTWNDFIDLIGQLPLVWVVAVYVDLNPLVSLGIGFVPDRIFEFLSKQGFSLSLISKGKSND